MKKPQSLIRLIAYDLFRTHWVLVLLVSFLTISAIGVTWASQQNRELNAQLARLIGQQKKLDVEWRKLRLEHRALAEHSRIEQLARERLKMIPVTAERETIIK